MCSNPIHTVCRDKSRITFTCYLCFSCFCFSFSGFLSPDCWWKVAWRHSHARLLQANKQHSGHMFCSLQNIATLRASQVWGRNSARCHILIFMISAAVFDACMQGKDLMQYFYTAPPTPTTLSLDNDVILNYNKPHQQTTTEGKEEPSLKHRVPVQLTILETCNNCAWSKIHTFIFAPCIYALNVFVITLISSINTTMSTFLDYKQAVQTDNVNTLNMWLYAPIKCSKATRLF